MGGIACWRFRGDFFNFFATLADKFLENVQTSLT